MEQLTDLKAILHSKRANIYYLEHCRVMQKDGRVLYLTEAEKQNQYWNIPIANTTCIMLGSGTSITQAAMRMLASAGVLVGFCGSDATPLFMGAEIEWLSPQSEYRPTEYVQGWLSWWFDAEKRLAVAKTFQLARLDYIERVWRSDRELAQAGFGVGMADSLAAHRQQIPEQPDTNHLLQLEARLSKELYRHAAEVTSYGAFVRDREAGDRANTFLNHGNYLAYGLAATVCWVLGIPHGFAVMHGKTRRGALVFDVADLIKDALVLPMAFLCARERSGRQEFRQETLEICTRHKALDYMFAQIKQAALSGQPDDIVSLGESPLQTSLDGDAS